MVKIGREACKSDEQIQLIEEITSEERLNYNILSLVKPDSFYGSRHVDIRHLNYD